MHIQHTLHNYASSRFMDKRDIVLTQGLETVENYIHITVTGLCLELVSHGSLTFIPRSEKVSKICHNFF